MATNWQIGDKIQNRWEIQKIHKGGMGIVFIAYDTESRQTCAIKTFQDELFVSDAHVAKRFEEEALAWIQLDWHPNVTRAHYVFKIAGKPFLFLEYVSGGDLNNWLNAHSSGENLPQVLRFAVQFCDGMQHILDKGIKAHRDIKPANCLITADGILKVTDFGLVKIFDDSRIANLEGERTGEAELEGRHLSTGLSCTGAGAGTPEYMAPEQFEDAKHVDHRADIYSFGIMLYQMVTGRLPFMFRVKNSMERWEAYQRAHKNKLPPALGSSIPALNEIVQKCLAKQSDGRFGDFAAVRQRLAECYESHTRLPAPPRSLEDERHYIYLNNKGMSLSELGRHEESLVYFDQVLAVRRSNYSRVVALTHKARTLEKLGRTDEALDCYERALEPGRMASWLELSDEIKSMILARPGYEFTFNGKGGLLGSLGRREEALACFDKALEMNPGFAAAWVNRGILLFDFKRYDEALSCFERALAINPQNFEVCLRKAAVLTESGRLEEALTCFDRALEIRPTAPLGWYNKGVLLSKLGRTRESLACFDRALELHPSDQNALFNKSVALRDLGLFSEALTCCDRLLDIVPQQASAWSQKGSLLTRLNRSAEALACLERALVLNQHCEYTWFNKGIVLSLKGDFQQALTCFEEAARLGHPQADQGIAICRRGLAAQPNAGSSASLEVDRQAGSRTG